MAGWRLAQGWLALAGRRLVGWLDAGWLAGGLLMAGWRLAGSWLGAGWRWMVCGWSAGWMLPGWLASFENLSQFGNFLNFFTLTEVSQGLNISIKFYK